MYNPIICPLQVALDEDGTLIDEDEILLEIAQISGEVDNTGMRPVVVAASRFDYTSDYPGWKRGGICDFDR